ncbi:MAG: ABC transporter substrate-binding protein [Oscillospiraceae bacterium]|nr:ABC transporter substrate-binding protein [Oscillospiraceae bacterium]
MKVTRFLSLLLALLMLCSMASAEAVTYVRGDDEEIYYALLGDFNEKLAEAKAAASIDESFAIFAEAEAMLLDSAVMLPNTTQGGAYTISRVAPRTIPYVQWGNDEDRWKGIIATNDDFLTPAEREELLALWSAAVAGEGVYDPAAYLIEKGHTIKSDYRVTFGTAPATLDWLNTSMQSDTEITVNTVDGLVEYNNLGQMMPALAESWTISEDGLVYTFKIREGVYWSTAEGTQYAEVTAQDFAAGFQHMMDAQEGLEWLVDGVVVGVSEYLGGESYDGVGYKALDKYTLEVTLTNPAPYFMTMLTYSIFLPICDSFFLSHGGAYGIEEYAEAVATEGYNFGLNSDVASQVYNGAFLVQKLTLDSEIHLVKNPNYWNPDSVKIDSITWIYDNGENPAQFYQAVVDGVYAGAGLTEASGTLAMAKEDGNFDKYSYISETTSTTYFAGLNMNRGTFALASGAVATTQTEQQRIDTHTALMNKNFRKAVTKAFDRGVWNAVSRGEDLKLTNLRNMYTHPEFVLLTADTTDAEGHVFPAGTFYGDMVQYYSDKLGNNINIKDGVDGWFDPEGAKAALAAAKEELGDTVSYPILIDVVYYSASVANTAQANACKQVIEECLGAENVVINLIESTTSDDYYAAGYRAPNGEAGNYDMFYGSGWAPDYGDPRSYLDTFLGEGAGYMTKVIGLF